MVTSSKTFLACTSEEILTPNPHTTNHARAVYAGSGELGARFDNGIHDCGRRPHHVFIHHFFNPLRAHFSSANHAKGFVASAKSALRHVLPGWRGAHRTHRHNFLGGFSLLIGQTTGYMVQSELDRRLDQVRASAVQMAQAVSYGLSAGSTGTATHALIRTADKTLSVPGNGAVRLSRFGRSTRIAHAMGS